jgi:magnesium transporter
MPATIHARSLCELPSEGQTFSDLFAGKGGVGGEVDDINPSPRAGAPNSDIGSIGRTASDGATPLNTADTIPSNPKQSLLAKAAGALGGQPVPGMSGGGDESPLSPSKTQSPDPEASTWWLDVLSPTDEEMRMFAKVSDTCYMVPSVYSPPSLPHQVFGIHPLTTEDILLEETREKIELFRSYYLVCFRSFDQDPYSQTYLEPLNMYIIVFREGTLSVSQAGARYD